MSDESESARQTADGGYVIAGYSGSNDGNVTGNHGFWDFWIVKLSGSGNIQWQQSLGGTDNDFAFAVQQTSDEGFVIAGSSESNNGDVSGNHGGADFWIIKLDAGGNLQWQKCLGGTGYDIAQSVQQTADGGYVAAGYSNSNDGDVTGHHGGNDYWIVKLDNVGDLQWQKSLGGTGIDEASSITQTTGGGYLVAGSSSSNDGDVTGFHGGSDYWVVKLDGIGNIQWEKCFGGTVSDIAYAVRQTYDGGFVVAGLSNSSNGDVTGNHGGSDHWIIKLNGSGNLQWQQCLGGSGNDNARSVQQTSDSGYVVTGSTLSNNGDVSGNHGGSDYWLVKLDGIGNIQWQVCMGGTLSDQAYSVYQTADEGYFVTGFSISNNGDVTGNHGGWDYWVVKLSPVVGIEEVSSRSSSTLFPNPFSTSATISFGRELRNATFTLYNLLGEVVSETSNIKGDSFQINRGTIPGGVYFYYLKEDDKIIAHGSAELL